MGEYIGGLFDSGTAPGEIPDSTVYIETGVPSASGASPGYITNAILDMMDMLHRANVSLYAFDPRGFVSQRERFREMEGAEPTLRMNDALRQAQDGLKLMAEASGGAAVVDSDGFDAGLTRLSTDLDHYYLLGFYPSDPNRKGYHRINVKVNRPGATVRYRRGYQLGREVKAPKNTDPLAALTASVVPTSELPMRMTAIPLPSGRKAAAVAVAFELTVPVKELERSDGRLVDTLKYSVLAADMKASKIRQRFTRTANITLKPTAQALRDKPDRIPYQLMTGMQLDPGLYQIRVSAISDTLGKGGSVYLTLDVPDFTKPPVAISGIALGYADGARVASGLSKLMVKAAPQFPIQLSLDREFTAQNRMSVYFEVKRENLAQVAAKIQAIDAKGAVLAEIDQPIPQKQAGVVVQLPLTTFGPGAYALRVTAGEASRQIAFSVR